MPALIALLWGALIQVVATLVGRAVVALGLGVVTYTGLTIALDSFKASAVSAVLALGPEVAGMLSMLRVGTFISIIFSAFLARLVLNGMTGDKVKKWVTR